MVEPDEAIRVRSAEVLTGIGELGLPRQWAVALAGCGPVFGHPVSMGAGLDSFCAPQGGPGAAQTVVVGARVA